MAVRDYFSFESIRDHEGNVVCYHVTMIGTIEDDGVARIRTDLGESEDKKMAFGRLTIRGCNKKIQVLTNETQSRIYYHSYTPEEGPVDIISFAAKGWRADEVYKFESGDRVLLEGRAYVRNNAIRDEEDEEKILRLPEVSVTVTGTFVLGRKRRQFRDLVPQKADAYKEEDEETLYTPSETSEEETLYTPGEAMSETHEEDALYAPLQPQEDMANEEAVASEQEEEKEKKKFFGLF